MKISLFEPTEQYLYKYINQRDILEQYLHLDINKRIRSPFRDDRNPSVSFKEMYGKVIWKDWGGKPGDTGDLINFIMRLEGATYKEVLYSLYEALIQGKYTKVPYKKNKELYEAKKPLKTVFNVTLRPFNNSDIAYWSQFGISIRMLNKYNVFPLERVAVPKENGSTFFLNHYADNPIYGYKFYNGGEEYWKIYRPEATGKQTKWLFNGNSDIIEGFEQLPLFGELLIITKSLKDVMTLKKLGYDAVSLQSEGNKLSSYNEKELKYRFKNIVVFYDNDDTGVENTIRMRNDYSLDSILIPKNIGTKDISDTYKKHGLNYCKELLNELISNNGIYREKDNSVLY